MAETADVVVIGGGSTGTSLAWQLAQLGAGRVILLERRGLAAQATGVTAGIVRTHYTHETLARMALRARQVFENFDDEVGGESGFRQTGFLALLGPDDVDTVAANIAMHRDLGINAYILAPEEIREIEPRLALFGIGAAAWEPESGYADPVRTTLSFANAARRHGAELRIGVGAERLIADASGIAGVETSVGRIATRSVIVANGFSSRSLVAPLGIELPLTPIRHAVAFMQRADHFGKPHPIISDRVLGSYYRPREDGHTMVGKTAPHDGEEDSDADAWPAPRPEFLQTVAERYRLRFPNQGAPAVNGATSGLYDCSPDLQPLLGPVPDMAGLHLAVGLSGHGFKLSPIFSRMLAEQLLTGESTQFDITLFSPARFIQERRIVPQHAYSVSTL
jgi:sarcosine oxidase subunit beta